MSHDERVHYFELPEEWSLGAWKPKKTLNLQI